jgi:hypothetical protein
MIFLKWGATILLGPYIGEGTRMAHIKHKRLVCIFLSGELWKCICSASDISKKTFSKYRYQYIIFFFINYKENIFN